MNCLSRASVRSSAIILLRLTGLIFPLSAASALGQQQYVQSTVTTIKTSNQAAAVHLATDGNGNIYISQFTQNEPGSNSFVEEVPNGAGGYTESSLPFAGYSFGALAVDSTGKLYFTGSNGSSFIQIETPSTAGSYTATSITNLGTPGPIAIDSAGDIFAIDYYGGYRVNEEIPTGGGNYNHVVLVAAGGIQGTGVGFGVDAAGNVYFADSSYSGNSILYKLAATGSGFTQSVVATLPASVTAVTADSAGDVYVAASDGRVYKETPSGTTYAQTVALSEFYAVNTMIVLPDSSLVVVGGYNLLAVKETPTASVLGSSPVFLPAQVAGSSTNGTAQFTFNSAATLAAAPYTVANPDFSVAGTQPAGACTAGDAYAAGDTCSLALNFAASSPGTRAGAVTLYSTGGQPLGSSLLSATGTAPMALVYPGVASTLLSGLPSQPSGIALDGAGNIYLSDSTNNRVLKETLTAGAYVQSVVTSNVISPAGVAVDGAGNVYVADAGNYRFLRETASPTGYLESSLLTGYLGYIAQPFGVSVDALGDVFVALYIQNGSAQVVSRETPANNVYTSTVIVPASRTLGIRSIAADGAGDLYFLSQAPDTIYKEAPAAGNMYTETEFTSGNYDGLLAADQTGNLYLASNGSVERFAFSNGAYSSAFLIPGLSNNYIDLNGVAVDPRGNLYFLTATGNYNNYGVGLYDPHQPPTLSYSTTNVGATSSPQSVTLANAGNTSLVISAPLPNPAFSLNSFAFDSTNTCPSASASGSASVVSGATCLAAVDFVPKQAGTLKATLTFTDNSLNAAAATQVIPLIGTGAGGLSIAPASLTFASTAVGSTSATLTATITNSGGAVTLTSGSLTDATDFTASNNCAGALAANATCTVSFTFTPQSATALSSTFSIADAGNPGVVLAVALSGTGTGSPAAAFSPASLTYTTVPNAQAPSQSTTLTNTGTATLAISSFAITGTNVPAFSIVSTTCGTALAAGASCTVTVGFTSTAAGTYTAALTANDNASPATQTVSLTGTVTGIPVASLTPATLTFSTTQGTSSAAQKAILTNTGTASLAISSVALAGANASSFAQTNTCGTSLALGASCSIAIAFDPATAGTFTASLAVTDNSGSTGSTTTTQTTSLAGTGTALAAPQAALTPASANFGSITAGTTSAAVVFTLSNAGTAALPITSVALGGANASSFTLGANNCGTSLAAGASCTVPVTFAPAAAGSFTAALAVVDAIGTQSSALSGTGTSTNPSDFSLTPNPASQSTYRGAEVTYNIQAAALLASNPFLSPVTLSVTGLPPGATASFTPAVLVPGVQASTVLSVNIPALSAAGNSAPFHKGRGRDTGVVFALLLVGAAFRRRKHSLPRLLTLVLLCGLSSLALSTTGCGTGNGFAVPTSTYSLVITGTSGATVHSTTVKLTVQ